MKKIITIICAAVITVSTIALLYNKTMTKDSKSFRIAISKAEEHAALNSIAKGLKDYLKKYKDIQYDEYTCQGNQATASQIASKAVSDKADVLVTIATTPTQASFKFAKENKIKLVFTGVTEPKDIANSLEGTNTTGVSDFVALKPQIELFKKIQPGLKNLGIIYNTGDTNSVTIVKRLRPIMKEMGINLVEQCLQKSSDIPQAVNAIIGKVDAVFISNDNTLLGGIPYVVKTCTANKVPVYVSDTDQVENGCLAALGPNEYDVGVQTGKMVEKVKNGEDINKISVEYPLKTELFVNLDMAKKVNITIPKEVLDKAATVIGAKPKR